MTWIPRVRALLSLAWHQWVGVNEKPEEFEVGDFLDKRLSLTESADLSPNDTAFYFKAQVLIHKALFKTFAAMTSCNYSLRNVAWATADTDLDEQGTIINVKAHAIKL